MAGKKWMDEKKSLTAKDRRGIQECAAAKKFKARI